MQTQYREVLIDNDQGDDAYGVAAPLLCDALQQISQTQLLNTILHRVKHVEYLQRELSTKSMHTFSEQDALTRFTAELSPFVPLLDAVHSLFAQLNEQMKYDAQDTASRTSCTEEEQQQQQHATQHRGNYSDVSSKHHHQEHEKQHKLSQRSRTQQAEECEYIVGKVLSNPFLVCHRDLHLERMYSCNLVESQALPWASLLKEKVEHQRHHHQQHEEVDNMTPLQLLLSLPCFNYSKFRCTLSELMKVCVDGRLFTACDPRLRVLRSRFALYRAYNSAVESTAHSSSSMEHDTRVSVQSIHAHRAPTIDLCRLETCMSANALLSFIQSLRERHPDYLVRRSSKCKTDMNVTGCVIVNNNNINNNDDEKESINKQKHKFSSKSDSNISSNIKKKEEKEKSTEICLNGAEDTQGDDELTITEALQRFFGHDVSQRVDSDCHLSADALGIRANYASENTQWLSLPFITGQLPSTSTHATYNNNSDDAMINSISTKHQNNNYNIVNCKSTYNIFTPDANTETLCQRNVQSNAFSKEVSELLMFFLHLRGGNNGELLAQLIIPVIQRAVRHSVHRVEVLELQLTISGCVPNELVEIAEWCAKYDLYAICPFLQFSLCITQDAFANSQHDHHNSNYNNDGASLPTYTWQTMTSNNNIYSKGNNKHQLHCAHNLADVLQNVFSPLWRALCEPLTHRALVLLLDHISTIGVEFNHAADVQELPAHVSCQSLSTEPSLCVQNNSILSCHHDIAKECLSKEQQKIKSSLHDNEENSYASECISHTELCKNEYPCHGPAPPNALFAYSIWSNVQLLNCMMYSQERINKSSTSLHQGEHTNNVDKHTYSVRHANSKSKHGSAEIKEMKGGNIDRNTKSRQQRAQPLHFRIHGGSDSRSLLMESVLGLLLADDIVNPTYVFQWSPLQYLYYLTQRHILMTPSRNRISSVNVRSTLMRAISTMVQVGLHSSVATLDPLFYHTTHHAMEEEVVDLIKYYGLSQTDVAEMSLHALEVQASFLTPAERFYLFGNAWWHAMAEYNNASFTHVHSLRLHHRERAWLHEMHLLTSWLHGDCCSAKDKSTVSCTKFVNKASSSNATFTAHSLPTYFTNVYSCILKSRKRSCSSNGDNHNQEQCKQELTLLPPSEEHREGLVEKAMHFPRIVIAGPRSHTPSNAARALIKAMLRRQHYLHYSLFTMSMEEMSNRQLHNVMKHVTEHNDNDDNSSTHQIILPTSFKMVDGVYEVDWQVQEPNKNVSSPSFPLDNSTTHASLHINDKTLAYFEPLPTWEVFQRDVRELRRLANASPEIHEYASRRLGMLECKYWLHVALTNDDEKSYTVNAHVLQQSDARMREKEIVLHTNTTKGDLYNCVKVDVHCHMAGGMTAKTLSNFMKRKLRSNPDDVVDLDQHTKQPITLAELFCKVLSKSRATSRQALYPSQAKSHVNNSNNVIDSKDKHGFSNGAGFVKSLESPSAIDNNNNNNEKSKWEVNLDDVSIGALNVQAGNRTFNRFDEFNNRYSPMRVSALRSLFLKTDNFMGGRYFAELIHETFAKQLEDGNTFSEFRLSIYGRKPSEWDELAKWFVLHGMSHCTNRWMIQIPRLFHLYKRSKILHNFQEMLTNIFAPLWDASVHPEQHSFLNYFLTHVSGFDSVDNESEHEGDELVFTTPEQWTYDRNPPFAYYMYYMWANITTLNRYRAARGLGTFSFRPHAGESGDPDHMADVFYIAHGVNHGIALSQRPVLQYLYYLTQIPLAMVPLSNNALFCKYKDNPFPGLFRRGLAVALATDGALMFHHTEEPLIEEYSTAQNFWNLSRCDMCEIAKNSVLMSGFPVITKQKWLGMLYRLRSVIGNDERLSHVPMTRCAFRYEVYQEEVVYLEERATVSLSNRFMRTPLEEDLYTMELLGLSRDEVLRRCFTHEPLVSANNEEKTFSQNNNSGLLVQVVNGNDVAATPFVVKSKHAQTGNNISNCSSSNSNAKQAHL